MVTIPVTCPHCETEKSGFESITAYPQETGVPKVWMFAVCPVCKVPVVLKMAREFGKYVHKATWPSLRRSTCPAHVPDDSKKAFLEGCHLTGKKISDGAGGHISMANSAGMAFRRALETATLHLSESKSQKDAQLKERIHKLRTNGIITEALGDWAERIRTIGNDAAHQGNITDDEARELKEFVEMFFLYAFTLPERVRIATSESNQTETDA